MRSFKFLLVVAFLLVPAAAFAWGPLTHIYLGNELFSLSPLIPPAILEIIRRFRTDFIYGNIMADTIIGKKYQPEEKNSHSWEVGFDLLNAASTDQQKAFVYGYLSHLAADTVAHGIYTVDKRDLGHTVMEMKADSIIDKKYWFQALAIERKIQTRNDIFLERSLDPLVFSFKTNRRICKSMVLLSVFNQQRVGDFIDRNLVTSLPCRETIESLQQASLDSMIDLFQHWQRSEVLKANPSAVAPKSRLVKTFLSVR